MSAKVWSLQSFATGGDFEPPAPARIKVLHPMLTTGPATDAEIVGYSDGCLKIQVQRMIVVGSMLQVRSGERVAFGKVLSSVEIAPGYEIEVEAKPLP
jgi:hypothetical protein